jgi:hypothetical protein
MPEESEIQFLARARDFSPPQRDETGFGAHTAFYVKGTKFSFPRAKNPSHEAAPRARAKLHKKSA